MLQKTALIECSNAVTRLTFPYCSLAVLVGVAGVVDLLSVLLAVPRVVELRLGGVRARVQRGCCRHHLERRARCVEARRRTIEQRGGRTGACVRRVNDARVAVRRLDLVRVVGRRGRHDVDGACLRVEHDGSAALAAQRRLRDPLRPDLQVQHEVVAANGRALELVGQLVPDSCRGSRSPPSGTRSPVVRGLRANDPASSSRPPVPRTRGWGTCGSRASGRRPCASRSSRARSCRRMHRSGRA